MRLASLRPVDRARVSELLIATAAFSTDEVAVALELFDETFDPACRPEHGVDDYAFIGAYENEDLIGYVCFGPTPATEGTYDLYWLAVDPAAQGRGAGRALVRAVEQDVVRRGGRMLVVETSSRADYAHTREFYARGGYVEAARVRDFYAPADDRIILTTRLTTREGGVATR